jgi:hypothetical protein
MVRWSAIISLLTFGMLVRVPGAPLTEPDAATIMNSGSTNRAGFRIVIDRTGAAELTSMPRRRVVQPDRTRPIEITVPRALTARFYADLKAASPLASLPENHCMKSVSFGSMLIIELSGEQTPDLNCGDGGNIFIGSLIRDVNEIVALFEGK